MDEKTTQQNRIIRKLVETAVEHGMTVTVNAVCAKNPNGTLPKTSKTVRVSRSTDVDHIMSRLREGDRPRVKRDGLQFRSESGKLLAWVLLDYTEPAYRVVAEGTLSNSDETEALKYAALTEAVAVYEGMFS